MRTIPIEGGMPWACPALLLVVCCRVPLAAWDGGTVPETGYQDGRTSHCSWRLQGKLLFFPLRDRGSGNLSWEIVDADPMIGMYEHASYRELCLPYDGSYLGEHQMSWAKMCSAAWHDGLRAVSTRYGFYIPRRLAAEAVKERCRVMRVRRVMGKGGYQCKRLETNRRTFEAFPVPGIRRRSYPHGSMLVICMPQHGTSSEGRRGAARGCV